MKWSKPIDLATLLSSGNATIIPDEKGCYRLLVKKGTFNKKFHGPSQVIYIGSASGKNSSLRKRIGLFICASLGFGVKHSGGNTFFQMRVESKLNLRNVFLQYFSTVNPICAENKAFNLFESEYQRLPLLCKKRPRNCCLRHSKTR